MSKLARFARKAPWDLAWGVLLAVQLAAAPNELRLDPESLGLPETARARLRDAIAEESWTTAEDILFEAAAGDPANALIERALGIVHYQVGRYLPAASALKRADEIDPLDAQARFLLASSFLRLERDHWARAELERLIEEDETDARYRYTLARIYYNQQRFGAAEAEIGRAILRNPTFADAHDLLGQCMEGLGRLRDAKEAYLSGIALNESEGIRSAWPYYHLGSLLHDEGDLVQAETALKLAVEADASHVPARLELGIVLGKLLKLDDAARNLEVAARLAPDDAKIQYSLAGVYRAQGLAERAADAIERFRQLSGGPR